MWVSWGTPSGNPASLKKSLATCRSRKEALWSTAPAKLPASCQHWPPATGVANLDLQLLSLLSLQETAAHQISYNDH